MNNSRAKHALRFLVLLLLPGVMAFAQELKVTSSSPEALKLFWQGLDKFENINNSQALPLFEQAVQKDPDFALGYLYKGSSTPDREKGRADMEKASSLKSKVSDGEQLLIDATIAFSKRETGTAMTNTEKLVAMFPNDKHVLLEAALISQNVGDPSKARNYATRATQVDNNFAAAYNLLGYAQVDLGDLVGAEHSLKTYTTLLPNEPNPHDSYAELLLTMGRYDESINHYNMALKLDPTFYFSAFGLGHNYVFKGDYAKARESYKRGMDISHSIAGQIDGLGWIADSYLHEGNTAEAVRTLERRQAVGAEHQRPAAVTSYQLAGLALVETGRAADGLKYFDRADEAMKSVKLNPDDVAFIMATSGPLRAYALAANHQIDAARAELKKSKPLVESRNDPQTKQNFATVTGLVESEAGNTDAALQSFSQGDPLNVLNTYHWAAVLEKKGDNTKAQELYGKVAKSNRNDLGLALLRTKAIEKSGGLQAGHPEMK